MCLTCYILCFTLVLLIIFLLIYKLIPIHRNCLKSSLLFFFSRLPDNSFVLALFEREKKWLKYLSLRVFLWIIFSIDDKDWWGDISKKGALPWQITAVMDLLAQCRHLYFVHRNLLAKEKSQMHFFGTITAVHSSFSIFKIYRKLTETFKGLKKVCNTVCNILGSMMI